MILDEQGQKELDRLWDEFDFIADFTPRTYVQYFFNQSGEVQGKGRESGTARPSDKEVTRRPVIFSDCATRISRRPTASNNPVASGGNPRSLSAGQRHAPSMETMHADAEPRHLDALLKFAARAYRKPLSQAERADMLAYYHTLRDEERD